MSSGYAWKGFVYKVTLDESVDREVAEQILERVERDVVEQELVSKELKGLRLGGRLVPYFSLANYSPHEQPAMERLRQIGASRYGLSKEGGNLRRSVIETSNKEGQRELLISVRWTTPFLRHLVARGVSRHPGTTTNFYVRIQEKGEVARFLRNETAVIARAAGINPRHLHIRFGGIIDR